MNKYLKLIGMLKEKSECLFLKTIDETELNKIQKYLDSLAQKEFRSYVSNPEPDYKLIYENALRRNKEHIKTVNILVDMVNGIIHEIDRAKERLS